MTTSVIDLTIDMADEVAATAGNEKETGIAAPAGGNPAGGYYGTVTGLNLTTGAITTMVAGSGISTIDVDIAPGVLQRQTVRNVVYRIYPGTRGLNGVTHTLSFTNKDLRLGESEVIVGFRPISAISLDTSHISTNAAQFPWSYNIKYKRLDVTLSDASAIAFGGMSLLIFEALVGKW